MNRNRLCIVSLIFLVLALCCTFCFSANNILKAETSTQLLTKLNFNLPNSTNITSICTTDNEIFSFTNNSTYLYFSNQEKPIVFKDLENSDYQTTSMVATLNNNITFAYIRTEQFTNQNIFELYKIYENKEVKKDPYLKVFENSEITTFSTHLSQISDLCFDYYNNFYMLDINNKAILTFNFENDRIEIFKDLSNPIANMGTIELNNNSKMCCTINGKYIFLLSQGLVYKLNTETKNIEIINIDSSLPLNNVHDFSCDAAESLYFLNNQSSNTSYIHKLTKQNTITTLNFNNEVSEIFIEEYVGNLYCVINNEIYIVDCENLIASTINYPEPINFYEQNYINSPVKIALCKENAKLFSSPYGLTENLVLNNNSIIIVLQEALLLEPDFAYCLFEENNTQTFGYILNNQIKEFAIFNQYSQEAKSTFVITNAYKYPTKSSTRLTTIDKNVVANILGYYSFTNTDININFYAVNIENSGTNKIAYIDKDLVFSQTIEEITYTGGNETPNKYKKFIEYLLIILTLTILEIITIAVIVKKVKINKKSVD